MEQFKDYAQRKSDSNKKDEPLTAAEIASGIVRASHHYFAINESPFINLFNDNDMYKNVNDSVKNDLISINNIPKFEEYLKDNVSSVMLNAMWNATNEMTWTWRSCIWTATTASDFNYSQWLLHPLKTIPFILILKPTKNDDDIASDNDTDIQMNSDNNSSIVLNNNDSNGSCNKILFLKKEYITPEKKTRFLGYFVESVTGMSIRGIKDINDVLNNLINNNALYDKFFVNPNKNVRDRVGFVLFHILRNSRIKSENILENYNCIDSNILIKKLIDKLLQTNNELLVLYEKEKIERKNANEKDNENRYNYFTQTIVMWILSCLNYGRIVFFYDLLLTFLPIFLIHRDDEKTRKNYCKYITSRISWITFKKNDVINILKILFNKNKKENIILFTKNWKTRKNLFDFLKIFISRQSIILNDTIYNNIISNIIEFGLKDDDVNVRISAKNTLTHLIIATPYLNNNNEINKLIKIFKNMSLIALPTLKESDKNNIKLLNEFKISLNKVLPIKHGGILGLCSLILCYPHRLPLWMPDILSFLSNFVNTRIPIKNTVKKTVNEFKKTHNDNWKSFKKKFTVEQLLDLKDISTLHSYFV